jgi:hypothetical protein
MNLHDDSSFRPIMCPVWYTLSAVGITGPLFLRENGNSERYGGLQGKRLAVFFFARNGMWSQRNVFQQDGARSHTANIILDDLNSHVHDRIISNRYPGRSAIGWLWSRYSPDVNLCDCFCGEFFRIMSIAIVLKLSQICKVKDAPLPKILVPMFWGQHCSHRPRVFENRVLRKIFGPKYTRN